MIALVVVADIVTVMTCIRGDTVLTPSVPLQPVDLLDIAVISYIAPWLP